MNNQNSDIILLRDIIRENYGVQNNAYYHNICNLWDISFELQQRQIDNKDYHSAGFSHCKKVEENLGKIILYLDKNNKQRFNLIELSLLSASACLHDAAKSGLFKENHASVIMNDLLENPEKYRLTPPFARILSIIVGSHDLDDVYEEAEETDCIGNTDVRPRLLSALLRLADVLDTDYSRIPHLTVEKIDTESDKTKFRKLVHGWYINDEGIIELRAQPEKPEDAYLISNGTQMMRNQLAKVTPYLHLMKCPYKITFTLDDRLLKKK